MQIPIYMPIHTESSNDGYVIAKLHSRYFYISNDLSNLIKWIKIAESRYDTGTAETSILGPYLCTVDSDNLPDLKSLYPELFI